MTIVYPLYPVLLDGVQGAKSNLFPFRTPYVILHCSNIDKVKGFASTRFILLTLIRSSLGNPLTCIYCLISYDFSHHIRVEIDFACFEVSRGDTTQSLDITKITRLVSPLHPLISFLGCSCIPNAHSLRVARSYAYGHARVITVILIILL